MKKIPDPNLNSNSNSNSSMRNHRPVSPPSKYDNDNNYSKSERYYDDEDEPHYKGSYTDEVRYNDNDNNSNNTYQRSTSSSRKNLPLQKIISEEEDHIRRISFQDNDYENEDRYENSKYRDNNNNNSNNNHNSYQLESPAARQLSAHIINSGLPSPASSHFNSSNSSFGSSNNNINDTSLSTTNHTGGGGSASSIRRSNTFNVGASKNPNGSAVLFPSLIPLSPPSRSTLTNSSNNNNSNSIASAFTSTSTSAPVSPFEDSAPRYSLDDQDVEYYDRSGITNSTRGQYDEPNFMNSNKQQQQQRKTQRPRASTYSGKTHHFGNDDDIDYNDDNDRDTVYEKFSKYPNSERYGDNNGQEDGLDEFGVPQTHRKKKIGGTGLLGQTRRKFLGPSTSASFYKTHGYDIDDYKYHQDEYYDHSVGGKNSSIVGVRTISSTSNSSSNKPDFDTNNNNSSSSNNASNDRRFDRSNKKKYTGKYHDVDDNDYDDDDNNDNADNYRNNNNKEYDPYENDDYTYYEKSRSKIPTMNNSSSGKGNNGKSIRTMPSTDGLWSKVKRTPTMLFERRNTVSGNMGGGGGNNESSNNNNNNENNNNNNGSGTFRRPRFLSSAGSSSSFSSKTKLPSYDYDDNINNNHNRNYQDNEYSNKYSRSRSNSIIKDSQSQSQSNINNKNNSNGIQLTSTKISSSSSTSKQNNYNNNRYDDEYADVPPEDISYRYRQHFGNTL